MGWNFAEDDVESSGANADAAEAAAKANTEASVREKFWGEILDKSFHHVSDDDGHVELVRGKGKPWQADSLSVSQIVPGTAEQQWNNNNELR